MRLLPLLPSAHPSAWKPEDDPGERQGCPDQPDLPCRFCGFHGPGWLEPVHLNGDHADGTPQNLVPGCVLCHLVQHLNRPFITREATLVWLPEMSQAAVVTLARQVHRVLRAHGEPPAMDRRPRRDTPALRSAYRAYRVLLDREVAADSRLGTSSPRDLGAALLQLSPDAYARRGDLLAGVRLLPLGRLYRGSDDAYPRLLDALPPLAAAA